MESRAGGQEEWRTGLCLCKPFIAVSSGGTSQGDTRVNAEGEGGGEYLCLPDAQPFSDLRSSDPVCPMSCALPSHANTHVRKHTCTHTHGVLQSRGSVLPSLEECRRGRGHRVPPLPCHLLATCGWLLEAAQAGKGSERGSSLLHLAQERSQQLQSRCEVMPGAACVFLQVETDSGRVGWQPQP